MKIKHIKSGQEDILTKEQWDTICANGFKSDFAVLADPVVPKEVKSGIKAAAESAEQTAIEQ